MRRNLEETKEYFAGDKYAALTGIEILEVDEGYAKCSMILDERHRNSKGGVHGGAIFTLADYCYGVAVDGAAVSMTSEINYLAASKGTVLTAEARMLKNGRTTVFFEVRVTDDLGKIVAFVTMTGYKIQ
ncbi:MAG: PaaI family thioesterase [Treponema sp.]|nr:PaaI family thioesterase [Treponema sp.]